MQSIWNLRAWCLQGCKRYRPCVVAVLNEPEGGIKRLKAATSVGRKSLRSASVGAKQTSPGRLAPSESAKAAFDRAERQKCFCVTFGESNKAYAPYPALITQQTGERILIEAND